MVEANFVDKSIWTGDNLDILRGLNAESVDLIYLDPPFNSNRNYAAPVGSRAAVSYKKQKHVLFGRQEGVCNGCRIAFLFPNLTIDHVVPRSRGGTDHLENLQLLCGACNSIKGYREMPYLIARLKEREG